MAMMEMATLPATPPATKPTTSQAKTTQSGPEGEKGFRTALNEENLKQARKATDNPETDQLDDSLSESVAAAAAFQPPADGKNPPIAETSQTPVVEGNGAAVAIIDPAFQTIAAGTLPLAPPPVQTAAQAKMPETTLQNPNPEAQAAPSPPVDPEMQANPDLKASITVAGTDRATVAQTTGLSPVTEVPVQQVAQIPQRPEQPILPESKSGQSGLMEASFAGILQPTAAKGQPLRGNQASEPAIETAATQLDGGKAQLSQAAQQTMAGDTGSDLSEALLKKPAGQATAAETGKSQNPVEQGQPSLFDNTLAATVTAKTLTGGDPGQLQGTSVAHAGVTSGSLNEEVRVLDQVLNQLSFNRAGDKNRVVIRLNPQELGEIKLELVMDKDHLKAQMVAQTRQVQEILEKHMPRLQEALQNQGIKVDQIEVSVDSQSNRGGEFFDRNQQPAPRAHSFGLNRNAAEAAATVAAVDQTRGRQEGLSLRI
jgi:flagellar hook-length control protein FliK